MGDFLEHLAAKPFAEGNHPLLVAGRAEVAGFAGEGKKVLMVAIYALHAGETVIQVAAFKVPLDHLFEVRPPETVLSLKAFLVDLNKLLEVVLDATVIRGMLGAAGAIDGA